jgi:hypothetical protein
VTVVLVVLGVWVGLQIIWLLLMGLGSVLGGA